MEILGLILYGILIFFTVAWLLGVRIKAVGYPTVLGSIYFLIASIFFPLLQINYLHILWLIPAILILIVINARLFAFLFVYHRNSLFCNSLCFVMDMYTTILRIGADKNKIKQQQIKQTIEDIEKLS